MKITDLKKWNAAINLETKLFMALAIGMILFYNIAFSYDGNLVIISLGSLLAITFLFNMYLFAQKKSWIVILLQFAMIFLCCFSILLGLVELVFYYLRQ